MRSARASALRPPACLLLLAAWVADAAPLPAQTTEDVRVDALVTDADGRPLAGVEFGDFWIHRDGSWAPRMLGNGAGEPEFLVSDVGGRVRGDWTCCFGMPLLALSPDRRLSARVRGQDCRAIEGGTKPATIVMAPAVEISVRFDLPEPAEPDSRFFCSVSWVPPPRPEDQSSSAYAEWSHANHAGWEFESEQGLMRIMIPRSPTNRYGIRPRLPALGDEWLQQYTFSVPPDAPSCDLGTISVPFSPTACLGQYLPEWLVMEASGSPREAGLPSDFAGKPLIVLLRRFSRLADAAPEETRVRELAETLAAHPRREEFQILLLNIDPWHRTLKDLDKFGIRQLPMVLDGTTVSTRLFPPECGEALLLDRTGRLVAFEAMEGGVLTALARLLEPISAPEPR